MLENTEKWFLCTHTTIIVLVSTVLSAWTRITFHTFSPVVSCNVFKTIFQFTPSHWRRCFFERTLQSKIFTLEKVTKYLFACDPFNEDNSQKCLKDYDTFSNENASVWLRHRPLLHTRNSAHRFNLPINVASKHLCIVIFLPVHTKNVLFVSKHILSNALLSTFWTKRTKTVSDSSFSLPCTH